MLSIGAEYRENELERRRDRGTAHCPRFSSALAFRQLDNTGSWTSSKLTLKPSGDSLDRTVTVQPQKIHDVAA